MAKIEQLAQAVADLSRRVERLEARGGDRPAPAKPADIGFLDELGKAGSEGVVVYAGVGPWGERTVAWQMDRSWPEVRDHPEGAPAALFGALASPTRIRVLSELAGGAMSTAELAQRLEQPSSGQLFHHLKELLAAGVIHQPRRGVYALRRQHVVPLLTILSCALDVAGPDLREDPT